jgi:hypothetical protein
MRRLFLPVALLGVALAPMSAADLRMKATTTWAENISRSSSPLDWRDSLIGEVSVTASLGRQLASGLLARGSAEAAASGSTRYSRLGFATLRATGQLQYKFGLGPMAPVLQGEVAVARREARIRGDDGYTTSAGLSFAKRFNEAWRARVAGDWQQHYARRETFDTHSQRVFGEVSWDLHPRWQVTAGYGRQWMDFVATAGPVVWPQARAGAFGAAIANYYATTPTLVTGAFGPGWTSYRVEGEADLRWFELSPALTERTSLALRYDRVLTLNRVNVEYQQDLWTLRLLHAF